MVTKPQIEKLSARIEALADAISTPSDGSDIVYALKACGETYEQALERIYQDRPNTQRARQVIVFSWLSTT